MKTKRSRVDREGHLYTRTDKERETLTKLGVPQRLSGIPNWIVVMKNAGSNGLRVGVARREALQRIAAGRSLLVMTTPETLAGTELGDALRTSGISLAAVEGGLLAGALAVALLVVLGWRARRDIRALALFLAFIPLVLTDHYPYTYLQGLVLLGTWVGALDGLARE